MPSGRTSCDHAPATFTTSATPRLIMDFLSLGSLGFILIAGILGYGSQTDVAIILFLVSVKKRDAIQAFANHLDLAIVLTTLTLYVLFQLYRYTNALQQISSPCELPVKPMLFPCETAHQRLFPKKHAFAYSYLLVGIPVGWRGSVGGMISSDVETKPESRISRLLSLKNRAAWYTVNSDDYLERGHVEGGLEMKLRRYLKSQVSWPSRHLIISPSNRPKES